MIVTLFGGVLLVVIVHGLGKVLGFPPFWRGIAAGLIPLGAYVVYASRQWPGLDVLAIHTAVYLSAATFLSLTAQREGAQPSAPPQHWAPRLFIGIFAVVLLLNAGFLYVAGNGLPPWLARWVLPGAGEGTLYTAFPGVVPHGAEAAKEIAAEMSARYRQLRLGWRIDVRGFDALARDGEGQLSVTAQARDGSPLQGARVRVEFLRPAAATADFAVDLVEADAGRHSAFVRLPEAGRWIAVVRVEAGADRYTSERELTVARRP